jgi:formiminoglutamate deiminase
LYKKVMQNQNPAGLFFKSALLPSGWVKNMRLKHANGLIAEIETNTTPAPGEDIHGIALPGMPNLHSHTFQRAMAGLAEHRVNFTESFWSWRSVMYRFAQNLSPDDIEIIATQAFIEMLETGFCSVAEFHYLHHRPNGAPYANIAETASRIAAAAAATGISLLLLPVFYAHANFGGLPPAPEQCRFINDLDSFEKLLTACRSLGPTGIAPHSLRAVTPAELQTLVAMAGNSPIHIHIAEQMQEVRDCISWSGARPVEFLLRNAPVGPNWCLVHATHADATERVAMAQAQATVGLCPITEANLGDGIFDAGHYLGQGGKFGIGTDSNVLISAAQELRQLEYSQRLARQERNILASSTDLYQHAAQGGAAALGQAPGLQPGAPANIVTLDTHGNDSALAQSIFASRENRVDSVWVLGRKCVSNGRHPMAQASRSRFQAVIAKLL